MKKLPLYLLIFLILLAVVIGFYFAVPYLLDGSTGTILRRYEVTRDSEMVRNHLLDRRGEGEGMSTRIDFVAWGIKHPDDFIAITDGIELNQREQFCETLGFISTDSGQDRAFEAAFEKYDSDCLRIIKSEIIRNREWLLRLKTSQNQ